MGLIQPGGVLSSKPSRKKKPVTRVPILWKPTKPKPKPKPSPINWGNLGKVTAKPAARKGGSMGTFTGPLAGNLRPPPARATKAPPGTREVVRAVAKRLGGAASTVQTRLRFGGPGSVSRTTRPSGGTKSTPAPPRRTAPVGGGSGGSGGSAGAAGAARAKKASTTKNTAASSKAAKDPIAELFKPLTDQMASEKAKNAELREKARLGLEAYNKWAMDSVQKGQEMFTNNMNTIRQQTSNNLSAIASNIGKFGGAGADSGMAGIAGTDTAAQIANLRGGAMASDTGSAGNLDAAIANRLAQQSAEVAARGQGFQTVQDALMNARDDEWSKRNAELMFNVGKVKADDLASQRQAAIDMMTAQAMAGDRALGRQIEMQRLGLDTQRAETDRQRALADIALKRVQARAKALDIKHGNRNKNVTYDKAFQWALAMRKRAAGGQYDAGKLTPEQANEALGNMALAMSNFVRENGLPPRYTTLILNDVLGAPNVRRALAAAKAMR